MRARLALLALFVVAVALVAVVGCARQETIELRVDGVAVPPREIPIVAGYAAGPSHSFRIDEAQTSAGELTLDLVVTRDSTRAAWIDTVPRLSATREGDAAFLFARTLDGPIVLGAFAVTSTIGFTYLVLFFFDRRRRAHLWFAMQGMGIAYLLIERLGVPELLALTATGVLMGTPLYMAPELGRGARAAAPSSDVFSFGIIAYELLSGRAPFSTPPVLDALAARTIDPPPKLDVDAKLAEMVARCLSLDPGARPTAAEIATALE